MNILQQMLQQIDTNPLINALPPRLSDTELYQALGRHPITPENVREIPRDRRILLLDAIKETFVPTAQTLKITSTLQAMLYNGLQRRDPRDAANRLFIHEAAKLKGKPANKLPWWSSNATGAVLEGITGTGKSHAVDAFLQRYQQVVTHGPNDACGWRELKQLVYLKVHMPADGTRHGFLEGAFREIDRVLGTDYSTQYTGTRWSVEKKLVVFLFVLAMHRCGLLVIEEAQAQNLADNEFSKLFITLFLRLLNWGVPIALLGNPLAFTRLKMFSQDADRFSDEGWFKLHPVLDPQSLDWGSRWLPALWLPTLLDEPDEEYVAFSEHPLDQTLAGFVWRRTAGFPRYVARLRREVQRRALQLGLSRVTTKLVDDVYQTSDTMQPLHERIDAFVRRDARALDGYLDIPGSTYRVLWASMAPKPRTGDSEQVRASTSDAAEVCAPAKRRSAPRGGAQKSTRRQRGAADSADPGAVRTREMQDSLIASMRQSSPPAA